jgi:sugar lactone lactonase YvrE
MSTSRIVTIVWRSLGLLALVAVAVALACEPASAAPKAKRRRAAPSAAKNIDPAKPQKKAELLVNLPDHCNTPDGMTVLPDGSIIVSMPNFNEPSAPPLLVKITKDNKVEDFLKLPPHPDTGRMGPMGIRVAPSGDLYLADNQLFHGKDGKSLFGKSRLVRIAMKDGKPEKVVPVASGLNVANGIAIHDGYVYVTETILVPDSKPLVSGVFRFKIGEEAVQMKTPLPDDPHLVLKVESSGKIGFGADGICFDGKGNLYVNCFEDAWIRKIKLDAAGKVFSNVMFAKAAFMKSCDGMDYDPRTNRIYVADLMANAVRMVSMDGTVETLAENADNDGSGGQLDGPCEALVRGNTIVVADMDFPVKGSDKAPGSVNTKFDKPYTISVIKLE